MGFDFGKKLAIAAGVVAGLVVAQAPAQAQIFFEDFETTVNSGLNSSITPFSDNSADYFTITDGTNINGTYNPTNQGNSFFAAQDIDGEGATNPATLSFNGINISGFTNLGFSGLFAEDDATDSNEDWDAPDFVSVQYSIDGGALQNLLAFENDGSTFNSEAFLDTDFDGIGDGQVLTDTFTQFNAGITGTGNSLDLLFTLSLDSGDEDIAFDNITITGDPDSTAVPTPAMLPGLIGFGMSILRKRKEQAAA